MKLLSLLVLFLGSVFIFAEDAIPSGTILPVSLVSRVDSSRAKAGDVVRGRIAQNVPLPSGHVIRAGSKVTGHIVQVSPGQNPAKVSLVFDTIEISGKSLPIRTDLRAVASMLEVEQAQIPTNGPDRGTPYSAWTTVQVGGDVVYRGGGPVVRGKEAVGTPVEGGVLSRVSSSAGKGCRGAMDGNSRPQALWVFSSDACGVYGLHNVAIFHAGRTDPMGEIALASTGDSLKLRSGTGMLLRVNGAPQASANANH